MVAIQTSRRKDAITSASEESTSAAANKGSANQRRAEDSAAATEATADAEGKSTTTGTHSASATETKSVNAGAGPVGIVENNTKITTNEVTTTRTSSESCTWPTRATTNRAAEVLRS